MRATPAPELPTVVEHQPAHAFSGDLASFHNAHPSVDVTYDPPTLSRPITGVETQVTEALHYDQRGKRLDEDGAILDYLRVPEFSDDFYRSKTAEGRANERFQASQIIGEVARKAAFHPKHTEAAVANDPNQLVDSLDTVIEDTRGLLDEWYQFKDPLNRLVDVHGRRDHFANHELQTRARQALLQAAVRTVGNAVLGPRGNVLTYENLHEIQNKTDLPLIPRYAHQIPPVREELPPARLEYSGSYAMTPERVYGYPVVEFNPQAANLVVQTPRGRVRVSILAPKHK